MSAVVISEYKNPWRPTFEAGAAVAWFSSGVLSTGIMVFGGYPSSPLLFTAGASFAWAAFRSAQALANWRAKSKLSTTVLPAVSPIALAKWVKANPGNIWLGYGFEWKPQHSQLLYDLRDLDIKQIAPPAFVLRLFERFSKERYIPDKHPLGQPWIHGIEPHETNIHLPIVAQAGHTLVLGTTGAGKTRLFEVLCSQAVHRGDVLIVFDPKGDKDWEQRLRLECRRSDREFVYFHLGHPRQSVRISPVKNWNMPTEIATRLKSIMESDAGKSSFSTKFGWDVINDIVNGMLILGERPNLKSITRYVIDTPAALAAKVLLRILSDRIGQEKLEMVLSNRKGNGDLPVIVQVYREFIPEHEYNPDVESLIAKGVHDKVHYSKVLIEVIPILKMLISGELGDLLSPNADDPDDERPIWDFKKVINQRAVMYIGLDMLSNDAVGAAVGSAFIEDLKAVAGDTYNYDEAPTKISLFVDEASEAVNKGFIQLMNKARGAGFNNTFASQTVADFEAKMGSSAEAMQMLGNANNLIVQRVVDTKTQEYVTEKFGTTMVRKMTRSHSVSSSTEKSVAHFGGSLSQSMSTQEQSKFPPECLGMLPNLQYIALLAGGRLIKGRLPILDRE